MIPRLAWHWRHSGTRSSLGAASVAASIEVCARRTDPIKQYSEDLAPGLYVVRRLLCAAGCFRQAPEARSFTVCWPLGYRISRGKEDCEP